MVDIWVLAFLMNGVIYTAGDAMPLSQCELRAAHMPIEHTSVVCVNISDPSCRVYKQVEYKQGNEARCRHRLKSE